ncbi:MAG: pilin [Magnetococcales bacterium]|nr:pilin [Magnetococcales bacterium]
MTGIRWSTTGKQTRQRVWSQAEAASGSEWRATAQATGVSRRGQAGFTLIELMIVIAIIGNLAAVAMPMFEQQVSRAQMAEAIGFLTDAKSALAEYYAVEGQFPDDITDAYGPSETLSNLGEYTNRISGWGYNWYGPPYDDWFYIYAQFRTSDVGQGLLLSRYIALRTTDGGRTWTCGYFWYGYERYYPSNCQNYI